MLRITFATKTLKIRHKIRHKEGYGIKKQCYFTVRRAIIFIWRGVVENVRYVHKKKVVATNPEYFANLHWEISLKNSSLLSQLALSCLLPNLFDSDNDKEKGKKDTDFWWTSLENLLPEGKGLAQQKVCRALQLGVRGVHTGNADIYSSPSASFSQPLFSSSSIAL